MPAPSLSRAFPLRTLPNFTTNKRVPRQRGACQLGTGTRINILEPFSTAVARSTFHSMPILLVFAAGETAAHPVLAVPAVARALREVHLAGLAHCGVYVPGGWLPSPAVAGEIERLAPGLAVTYCKLMPIQPMLIVCGEKQLSHQELCAMLPSEHRISPSLCETQGQQSGKCALPLATAKAVLATRSRELLSATGKLSDGIVSRHLNRPISQAITRVVLRALGPIQPIKATAVTAMISVAMIAVLVLQGRVAAALSKHALRVIPVDSTRRPESIKALHNQSRLSNVFFIT